MFPALALAALVVLAVLRLFGGYPAAPRPFRVLAPREAAFLSAAAGATFPPGGAVPPSGAEADVASYTDRWLTTVTPRLRILMRLLFFLVEQATVFFPAPAPRGWRRFSSLSPEQRAAVLEGWRRSRFFPRRLVFTSLRAILTMAYFAHPPVLRALKVAPLAVRTPVCEADLLYPPIGRGPEAISYGPSDLTPPSDGTPLDPAGPLDPRYAEASP
jgi:hypothetical protein